MVVEAWVDRAVWSKEMKQPAAGGSQELFSPTINNVKRLTLITLFNLGKNIHIGTCSVSSFTKII